MLAMVVTASYQVLLTERQIDDGHEAERAFTTFAWKLTVSLSDLRSAQQAYVAAGQDRTYWVDKVASHLEVITESLSSLVRLAKAPATVDALEQATAVVEDLRRMDALAREHTAAGQDLMASDLIFTDGLELAQRSASHVAFARATEQQARNRLQRERLNAQVVALAAALGTSIVAALLLLPIPRSKRETGSANSNVVLLDTADAEIVSVQAQPESRLLLNLDGDRLSLAESTINSLAEQTSEGPSLTAPISPDLQLAADLCTDLGRLSDTEELSSLLTRTAVLLNASGIIVWVRDSAGSSLRPAIGHGYPSQALSRMGVISYDGDNATAAAYRSVQMQVVTGNGGNGAIVVPLISATSCVGVMSAELQEGWETSDTVQAMASIVAAQLATLVVADSPVRSEPTQSRQSVR